MATLSDVPAKGPLHAEDVRAFPRRRAKGSATVRPADQVCARGKPAKLTDLSHGGLGLLSAVPAEVGAWLCVELIPVSGPVLVREAEVRWAVPDSRGQFRLGLRFRNRLTFPEMQKFL